MRVSVVQLGYDDREPPAERVARVQSLVATQRDQDIVILPELWAATAFGAEFWPERAESRLGPTVEALQVSARSAKVQVHFGAIIERTEDGRLWNTAGIISASGNIIAYYRKVHLFGAESRYLSPGDRPVSVGLSRKATQADPSSTVTAGLATCYDLRFPEYFRLLGQAEVIFIAAAWPLARIKHWVVLSQARAIENQAFVVACNTVGEHAGVALGGRSQIIDPAGEVLAQAGSQAEVIQAELDFPRLRKLRREFPVLNDRVW